MKVDLLNAPFEKRVNFNGKVSIFVMKMVYLYPMEVYNFELRFSENVIQNGCTVNSRYYEPPI